MDKTIGLKQYVLLCDPPPKKWEIIALKIMMDSLASLTCDNKTLIIIEGFSEETRNDEFRVYKETYFFLNKAGTDNSSSDKLVGKIHLKKKRHNSKR